MLDELPPGSLVVDIGAKDARGKKSPGAASLRYISLDLAGAPGIDVIADAHAIPLAGASADAILCVSVLMYCENPFIVAGEMYRILKPGGLIYVNVPFVYRAAPDPVDYYRFSETGLAKVFRAFTPIQTGFNRGPASTMADMLTHYLAIVFCFGRQPVHDVLVDFFQWALFWTKYLDRFIAGYPMAWTIHSGAFFYGRKPLSEERVR